MLKLNNTVVERYNHSIDNIDISDMNSIHETMYQYANLFDSSKLSHSEATALAILKKNIISIVDETFDYRSKDFDANVSYLLETLNNIPRCHITEPLFSICEKCVGVVDNNNLLTISQEHKSIGECPADFVLYKMYSNGFVSHREMDTYKVSLETEVYGLVNSLQLIDDMRADDTTVPTEPQNRTSEVIHPNFHTICNIFDNYKSCNFNNKDSELYNYSCTPNAIIDKIYLCNINFDGNEEIDTTDPMHVKLCQQATVLMNALHCHLEKLVLDDFNSDITTNLHRLAVKFVALLEAAPSVTASVIAKLLVCCLIDSTHLHGNTSRVNKKTLDNLIKQIDRGSLSIGDELCNDPKCLLNFQYLCDIMNRVCVSTDTDIDGVVNENMELLTNPDNDYVHTLSIQSASLETYETSMNSLAEMFQVMSDGTIKVSIEEKTTYMNEYAMNHRLLKYNCQQKDWEAAKYNIVYHMILIDSIEKNVLYNKKVKKESDLYKDAEQARRMAKSDIATYLPEIRLHVPSFDLNAMYKKVKADKATITIQGAETASGIKTILKHILY